MSYQNIDIPQILQSMGFTDLKPMQKEVLDKSSKNKNLLVLAPTGSGKTLAFLLTLIKKLDAEKEGVQSLILAPTRELALQIEQVFRQVKTGFKVLTCYGGHPFSRERSSLKNPPTLIIATPGRLLDHLQRKTFDPRNIHTLIIDEYDKCLELGFTKEMQSILYQLPRINHTILTSATEIESLPKYFNIKEAASINYLDTDVMPQLSYFYVVSEWTNKLKQLEELLKSFQNEPSIVFCNFKNDIQDISLFLSQAQLPHSVFYGDLDQEEREKSLLKFRNGSANILLATDLAARGLDIPAIKNIVHFQIPSKEDTFIHRNGRTARMQQKGNVFLLLMDNKTLPEYIDTNIREFRPVIHEETLAPPSNTTIYMSAGKMHKISKIDVVGFLCQIGGLPKDKLGLIEIKDRASFAAIDSTLVNQVIQNCNGQKLKKMRVLVAKA